MKGLRPFGVALRREMSNRFMLRWWMTVAVSDEEKASLTCQGDQESERERTVADVSKREMASKLGRLRGSRMSLAGARVLARRRPACRPRDPGLRLLQGTWKASVDTVLAGVWVGGEKERAGQREL